MPWAPWFSMLASQSRASWAACCRAWITRVMSGVLGLHGWQWIFAVEGAPAIVLGVIA
ncbi:MAG TPA: hypothetical protein VKJ77_04980 [Caballeronia sp.]|nr:hypothetical protein [Caballeronia sp.]